MLNKFELQESLHKCLAYVTFTKADGTERKMYCTLMAEYLPEPAPLEESHVPRKQNDEALAVWDLDKKAWRSFRLDSVQKVEFMGVDRA